MLIILITTVRTKFDLTVPGGLDARLRAFSSANKLSGKLERQHFKKVQAKMKKLENLMKKNEVAIKTIHQEIVATRQQIQDLQE
ncbi:hypothetical protein G6F42_012050 [Rhizopus arrhizus]|nr:hypothetical protein G6F42_012050 [Rhizopus arrhizus]